MQAGTPRTITSFLPALLAQLIPNTITSFLPALLAQLIPNTTATHTITYTNIMYCLGVGGIL